MQTIVIISGGLVFVAAIAGIGFWVARKRLRMSKSIERGLKMVPMLIHLPPTSDDTEVGSRDVRDVIEEKISQAETMYNIIASTAKKGFKSNFYGQRHLSFELIAKNGVVNYYVAVPIVLVEVVKQAVLSAYPTARLEEVEEHNIFNEAGKITGTIGGELNLKKDYPYPIATFKDTKRDVMVSLLNALSSLQTEDGAAIQIMIRPAKDKWEKAAHSLVGKKKKDKGSSSSFKPFSFKDLVQAPFKPPEASETKPEDKQLTNLEQSTLDAIEQKTRSVGYETMIRVVASSNTAQRSQAVLHNIVAAFSLFNSQGLNGFKYSEAKDIEKFVTAFIMRFFPPEQNANVLNSVELATLFHFPDSKFSPTSQLKRQASKQVDGPRNIPPDGQLLGYNVFRGVKKKIYLSPEDRRRHAYIVGQTGTGKSVLLENMAIQDMLNGNGFAFIDPHGDSAEELLSLVPKERTEDVIYFNPGDMDYPLGINLFEFRDEEQKDFLIQESINMLYRLYDPEKQGIIGPRFEVMFRNAALTLMADPAGATFIEIPKLFVNKEFLRDKLKHVDDPTVLEYWNKEVPASRRSNDFGEVVAWMSSKFGAFISNKMMRNIIGQAKSSFDLREVMDEKKILIVNLSKGRTGELNSMLLGMIFVMKFQAAAMSRANIPKEDRVDFSLYVDEFQNFSTESFATILSEARKYRLNLIVANQFIGQLTEEIRDAVFGNVGTIVALRCSATDADFLVKQFSPTFDTGDLVKLPNYNAIMNLLIGGMPSQPFSMSTIPPLGNPSDELGRALKQLSAAKYGRPRKVVEKEIFARMETEDTTKPRSPAPGRPASPATKPPAAPGSSSFLDEWLAKRRRMQTKSGGQAPPTPPDRSTTAAASGPSATPQQPVASRSTFTSAGNTQSPQPTPAAQSAAAQPSTRAAVAPPNTMSADQPPTQQAEAAPRQAEPARLAHDAGTDPTPRSQVKIDRAEKNTQASATTTLPDESTAGIRQNPSGRLITPTRAKPDDDVANYASQIKQNAARGDSQPADKNLSEQEIYIDDNGNLISGSQPNKN